MRREKEQSNMNPEMRKKLVLKLVVLEYDFANEEALPTSLSNSRLDVAAKLVRWQSPVRGKAAGDTLAAKVSPLGPPEVVPPSA